MLETLSEQLTKYASIVKKIEEKYPSCEIECVKDWYMPVEKQELIYTVVTPRKVTILEEFLLNAATSDFQDTLSVKMLADLLSLDEVFIDSCVEELSEKNIIKKNELPHIVITELGREYFKYKAIPLKPTAEKIIYYIDRKFGIHYSKIVDTKDLTIPEGNVIIEKRKENIKKYINKAFVISVGKDQNRQIEEPGMKKRFFEAVSVKTVEKSHTLMSEFLCYDSLKGKKFCCIWDHAKEIFNDEIAGFLYYHGETQQQNELTTQSTTKKIAIVGSSAIFSDYDSYGTTYEYPIYDVEGYDQNGFNYYGYDREGYNLKGFNSKGYNRNGFDMNGYDKDGYNEYGFNDDGFTRDGIHDERIGAKVEHISCGQGRIIGFYEKDGKKYFAVKYDNKSQKDGKFLYSEKVLAILKFIDFTPSFDE